MLWPTMPARQKTLGGWPLSACTSMLPMPQNSPVPLLVDLQQADGGAARRAQLLVARASAIALDRQVANSRITSTARSAATDDS